jgi:transcriptional regulator with XRE-family HTH domain
MNDYRFLRELFTIIYTLRICHFICTSFITNEIQCGRRFTLQPRYSQPTQESRYMARTEDRRPRYLREWMDAKGVTPKDLVADHIVGYSTFRRIEKGKEYFRSSLLAIANRLGVPYEQLFEPPDPAKINTLRNLLADPEAMLDDGIRLPKYLRESINASVIAWKHEESRKEWVGRLKEAAEKHDPNGKISSSPK